MSLSSLAPRLHWDPGAVPGLSPAAPVGGIDDDAADDGCNRGLVFLIWACRPICSGLGSGWTLSGMANGFLDMIGASTPVSQPRLTDLSSKMACFIQKLRY